MAEGKAKLNAGEPRWPAVLAIVVMGLVYAGLPGYLSMGPRWLLVVLVCVLEVPVMVSHRRGLQGMNQLLAYCVLGLTTGFLMWSLALLIVRLPAHQEPAVEMLRSAAVLWVSNVVVFALWYWRLDGGGPAGRDKKPGHTEGAFLFPQMTWEVTRGKWSPRFVDYLFLSFNTATALSATDTPILSRWAKVLVMVEAGISLVVVILLAARAVNIM